MPQPTRQITSSQPKSTGRLSAAEWLNLWGRAMFGEDDGWMVQAARRLQINDLTFKRMVKGKHEVDWDHPVVQRAVAIARRVAEMTP